MADQVQIDGAGVQLAYDGPVQAEVHGAGLQLVYDLVGLLQLDSAGVQLVYSDVPPPSPIKRKFPIVPAGRILQSQPGARVFPVIV